MYLLISQKYKWLSFLTYRLQAFVWIVASSFNVIYPLVTITVIYSISSGIAGWSYYQLIFLAATASAAMGMAWYFADASNIIDGLLYGSADKIFTRPYGLLTLLMVEYGDVIAAPTIIGAIALMAFAALHLQLSAQLLLYYLVLLSLGTIAYAMFLLMLTALAYKYFRRGTFVWRMVNFVGEASNYPISAYGFVVAGLFSTVIPIGFAYYYPSVLLFGGFNATLFYGSAVFCVAVSVACYKAFYLLMRSYTSAKG